MTNKLLTILAPHKIRRITKASNQIKYPQDYDIYSQTVSRYNLDIRKFSASSKIRYRKSQCPSLPAYLYYKIVQYRAHRSLLVWAISDLPAFLSTTSYYT